MTKVQELLFEYQDKEYAVFQAKLTPTVELDKFIGVRVPQTRKLAKTYTKEQDCESFFNDLPHTYYDEDMFHVLLISEIKEYDKCIQEIEKFLLYIDNWAVCDILSPKCFKKNKDKLIDKIKIWSASSETYTCRFGLEMLMSHYLDDEFKEEYLEIPASIVSEEYYVNMMIAWFMATALAKKWDATIPYIEQNRLSLWVHNKTIQKAIESYRITDEQKAYLRSLRRKKE